MAEPEVLGTFTNGEWRLIGVTDDEDGEAKSLREAAIESLHDELGLITNSETLVVLSGLGTSLGVMNAKDKVKTAPRMSDLWTKVQSLASFTAAESKLDPSIVASGNLEHILSDAQARFAINNDEVLKVFIAKAEEVIWTSCSFIDEHSKVDTHELFLRKVARRSTRLQRTQIYTTNYDLAFEAAARCRRRLKTRP